MQIFSLDVLVMSRLRHSVPSNCIRPVKDFHLLHLAERPSACQPGFSMLIGHRREFQGLPPRKMSSSNGAGNRYLVDVLFQSLEIAPQAPSPAAKTIASVDGDPSYGAKSLEDLDPATSCWALVQAWFSGTVVITRDMNCYKRREIWVQKAR